MPLQKTYNWHFIISHSANQHSGHKPQNLRIHALSGRVKSFIVLHTTSYTILNMEKYAPKIWPIIRKTVGKRLHVVARDVSIFKERILQKKYL